MSSTVRKCELYFEGYWLRDELSEMYTYPGIYCVYRCTFNVKTNELTPKELVYIGRAEDVQRRLREHNSYRFDEWEEHFPINDKLCFTYAYMKKANLKICEAALLHEVFPRFNNSRPKIEKKIELQLKVTGYRGPIPKRTTFVPGFGKFLHS